MWKEKKRGNACIRCIQCFVSAVIRTAHAPWQKPIAKRANHKQEEVERERAKMLNESTNLSVIAVERDRVISCGLHRCAIKRSLYKYARRSSETLSRQRLDGGRFYVVWIPGRAIRVRDVAFVGCTWTRKLSASLARDG